MYKMIFLVNQKTNWDFPAKKKILDHYKKPRINLKRTIAVLGKLGFYLNYVGCKGYLFAARRCKGGVLP